MKTSLSFLALFVVLHVTSSDAHAEPPHIILTMADDLGWGDVGYHGSKIDTPNIGGLAKRGVRLEQFYARPVCSPTHGALLTGRYPMRLGFVQQYGHYNGMLAYFTHIRDGGHDWHRNDRPNYGQGYTTDLIGDEAVQVIGAHDKTKPMFLYAPFNSPHTPL